MKTLLLEMNHSYLPTHVVREETVYPATFAGRTGGEFAWLSHGPWTLAASYRAVSDRENRTLPAGSIVFLWFAGSASQHSIWGVMLPTGRKGGQGTRRRARRARREALRRLMLRAPVL